MEIKTVDVKTLQEWIDKDEAVIVDVREPAEHQKQSIPGSTLVSMGSLSLEALPNFKGKKLVVHCGGGGRAGRACEALLLADPGLEVYNLKGGLRSWAAAGNHVKTS